ncbi:MAG TPA: pentapeptide repeat-containing protein [Polyangiaceae bacterium]|jgi:uncharacterized protein YjbI with pentapeptide repeats
MADRNRLEAHERAALRGRPPTDPSGRRLPWKLASAAVSDEEWQDEAFEIDELTLDDVALERLRWSAHGVFRKCVLRGVTFDDVVLTGMRFEDVLFEACDLRELVTEGCAFVRCRFVGGGLHEWRALRTQLAQCTWAGVDAGGWELDDCEMSRCALEETSLEGLRATGCTLSCKVTGGALESVDLTQCKGEVLEVDGARLKGVRALDVELGRLSLSRIAGGQISLGKCRVSAFALRECTDLTSFSLVGSKVDALRIEACPSLQDVFVRGSTLREVSVSGTTLGDTTFEDVDAPGDARIEKSTLRGTFFHGGAWASLTLSDVLLSDYITVEGARFAVLHKSQVREADGLRRLLQGEQYGAASMTWGP